MNNSLWLLWSGSKEWLLRLTWVIIGLFVSVLGALWAGAQLGAPLHIPLGFFWETRGSFCPRFLALKCCYGGGTAVPGFSFHYDAIESLSSLFHSNKEVFVEHLTRYKVLSTALWIYRVKVDFMCYVLKGKVAEAWGPGRRGSGSFCQNDQLPASHHILR